MSSHHSDPNPNILIVGRPGRGKSDLAKKLAMRLSDPETRPTRIIHDPAGDYVPLAGMLGGKPFRIGPGLSVRLDPLDLRPLPGDLPGDLAGEW